MLNTLRQVGSVPGRPPSTDIHEGPIKSRFVNNKGTESALEPCSNVGQKPLAPHYFCLHADDSCPHLAGYAG